jgi:branched-chain amino acid transport system substrate-binding protein
VRLPPMRTFVLLGAAVLLAGCGGSDKTTRSLLVAVDAPFSTSPHIGDTIAHGVQLAADEINAQGGIGTSDAIYTLKVKKYDNALSPRRALANVRRALADGAVAIVDDGTGVDASWQVANAKHVPIGITYGGGMHLVDPAARPNVFRIAPTDRGVAFRLAEYVIPKGLKVALLHDDSGYGRDGAAALHKAFAGSSSVAADLTLPAGELDLSPQVLRAKRAGATALLVWGLPATIADVVVAARSAGWDVPVFAPPDAEDPAVRQQLADRPSWLEGLTFASGRMTSELGPDFFAAFQAKLESAYGVDDTGVKTSAGKSVFVPPDYEMYSYDFVNVLAQAIRSYGIGDLPNALEQVTVRGANGDERGFNEHSHEGVVDDDVYFARFRDMTYAPVRDDALSRTLPVIAQTR